MTHSLSNSLRVVVVVAKLPQRIYAAAANYTNLAVAAVAVVVVDLTQARCHCARLHWAPRCCCCCSESFSTSETWKHIRKSALFTQHKYAKRLCKLTVEITLQIAMQKPVVVALGKYRKWFVKHIYLNAELVYPTNQLGICWLA